MEEIVQYLRKQLDIAHMNAAVAHSEKAQWQRRYQEAYQLLTPKKKEQLKASGGNG